jgi:hypothetical protein
LRTGDTATNEAEIAGIPAEILAIEFGIIDGAVIGFPKGIFRIENGVVDFDIFGVLEDIPAVQLQIRYLSVSAMAKGFIAIGHAYAFQR